MQGKMWTWKLKREEKGRKLKNKTKTFLSKSKSNWQRGYKLSEDQSFDAEHVHCSLHAKQRGRPVWSCAQGTNEWEMMNSIHGDTAQCVFSNFAVMYRGLGCSPTSFVLTTICSHHIWRNTGNTALHYTAWTRGLWKGWKREKRSCYPI